MTYSSIVYIAQIQILLVNLLQKYIFFNFLLEMDFCCYLLNYAKSGSQTTCIHEYNRNISP